jgi:hypothetical protein
VFVACEIEDLPGAEVARVLGIPEGTLCTQRFGEFVACSLSQREEFQWVPPSLGPV